MIVSFFARGSGGGSGPVDYLLGKDRKREHAELLKGDPDETAAIIDSSKYSKKYTAGVLSFEEKNIPNQLKSQIMQDFEECLFPGLDKNQYNVLWIEHTDKGRLELNFVIPNIELTTGKRLQPYYHAADKPRVDAWQTITNIEHDFSDPHDPSKQQTLTLAKDLPRNKLEALQAINEGLMGLAEAGGIKDRQDVLQALEGAGFEVARQTKTSISIKDPEGGRNIRLKGAFYEQNFRFSKELQRTIEQRGRDFKQSASERLHEARDRYHFGIEQRQRALASRYPSEQRGLAPRDRRESKAHELGSIQTVGVADSLAVSSARAVDDLERLTGLDDIRPKTDHSRGQKDVNGATRGVSIREREREHVYRAGQEEQGQARSVSSEVGRVGSQIGGQVNDRSRTNVVRYIESLEQDERERKQANTGLFGTLGREAEANNNALRGLKRASDGVREQPRRAKLIDVAKQAIDSALRAFDQFARLVGRKEQQKQQEAVQQSQKNQSRGFGMSR